MHAYHESYLKEIVETQGKLFDEVTEYMPGIDVKKFIIDYMTSKKVITLIPLDFILTAYPGLHDLELDLAVRKVGEQLVKQKNNMFS